MANMKRSALVLLAVFALAVVRFAPLQAQTVPATASTASSAAATQELQRFLATLSAEQKQKQTQTQAQKDQAPAAAAGTALVACTTNSDCPTGQLCCPSCGADPGDGTGCRACMSPMPLHGRCPIIVSSPSRPASFKP